MRRDGHQGWTRGRCWAVLGSLALVSGAAMSAHAAWRAIAGHARPIAAERAATGYEAQDHFPGSALFYADTESDAVAAPAAGVTGTTALPAIPISAGDRGPSGVVPAAPFFGGSSSAVDRGRAVECLTAAIYYEAASESDAGQQAVAQVVLNRVRHPAFPATVCGVVYQGADHAGCQFSFACDGAMARMPSRTEWARAARAAAMALAGRVYAPVGLATHYHTFAVTPAWNRGLVMTDVVGAHFFHRWKGYWGTASAFHQAYRGGEPVPGPKRADTMPVATVIPAIVVPAIAATSHIAPAPVATPTHTLPPESQILDRWKDSGRPIG